MVRSFQKGLWPYKLDIKLYTFNGLGLGFKLKRVDLKLEVGPEVGPEVGQEVGPEVEPDVEPQVELKMNNCLWNLDSFIELFELKNAYSKLCKNSI